MITLRISKPHVDSIKDGCPWVMRHQAVESSEWMAAEAGSLAQVESERGEYIGIGMVNPHSQIVCRMLSWQRESIDAAFFTKRLGQALARREALFDAPYYRLVHSEADSLSGLIIDRFDDTLVVQVASAGMEKLQPIWLVALEHLLEPRAVVMRNDFSARKLEGLTQCVSVVYPERSVAESKDLSQADKDPSATLGISQILENNCIYLADLMNGQKTGWFYDIRDNRKMVAELSKDKSVLDVFSHSGGFGLLAAKHGASAVTMVDASQLALDLAMQAAAENGLTQCDVRKGDAVAVMKKLAAEGKQYDIVIADPPAYVKSKKDIAAGMKGYEKVAEHAAQLVVQGGLLFTASCSYHASRGAFNKAVLAGITKAGRKAEIIKQTGASRDHPIHPKLPQGEYLKGLLLKIN